MDGSAVKVPATDIDVVVIGAGFGGLTMLYRLRERGFSMQGVEMGDGVGGTWFWNRYPGARVDIQSVEYSLSISREVQDEWTWTELMAPQAELERYVNFVADRLDLRRHIKFNTRVTAMTWDEASATWRVETDQGEVWRARFVVTAVGCLSAPLEPAIEGLHSFAGDTLYTNRFPKDGYDFSGKRAAIVGTGSSGVQATPVVARQAEHLTVFQRSAAYTMPAGNRAWAPGEFEALREDYDTIRAAQLNSALGAARFGAVAIDPTAAPPPNILDFTPEERLARLDRDGWLAATPFAWADVGLNMEANLAAQALYAEMIRREVKDPETAAALVPHYPMGCKRPIIDIGYFDTFNRENVTLVDLRKGAIQRVTPEGIETGQGFFPLDVIVYATGFDAMTGALNRIDIKGRDGGGLPEPVHHHRARQPVGADQHGRLDRAAQRLDRRLPGGDAGQGLADDRGGTGRAGGLGDARRRARRGRRAGARELHVLVPGRQRAREGAGLHALRRRPERLPRPLRRGHPRRLCGVCAGVNPFPHP